MSQDRFETRVVHAGLEPDPAWGSVIPAIHQSSTFAQRAVGEVFEDFDYSRAANPTRSALERALGDLEGGRGSAFSSGMAATHALITATCSAGDHVVIPADLYGGTYRLMDKVLSRWGLRYTMVDQTDLDALAAAVADDTRLIWVETPTNPLLNVVDVAGVVARKRNALVAVDNTFATPANQRPLEDGADAVVHSTTKYLGGHGGVGALDRLVGHRLGHLDERLDAAQRLGQREQARGLGDRHGVGVAEGDHAAEAGPAHVVGALGAAQPLGHGGGALGVRAHAHGQRAQPAVHEEAVEGARHGADRLLHEAHLLVQLGIAHDHGAADHV